MDKKLLIAILFFILLFAACRSDKEECPIVEKDKWGWHNFLGKTFTSESTDFYWTVDYPHDKIEYLKEGEYVEFYNLTDSSITMRYGNIEQAYCDLAEITNNRIQQIVACPNSALVVPQSMDIELKFKPEKYTSYCNFESDYTNPYGFTFKFSGKILHKLTIMKEREYICTVPAFRQAKMNWDTLPYNYIYSTLKCESSPMIISWKSSGWDGNISSLIPDASEFIQLLIGLPVINNSEYFSKSTDGEKKTSIVEIITHYFPGFSKKVFMYYNGDVSTGEYVERQLHAGFFYDAIITSKIAKNTMDVIVDASLIFKQYIDPNSRFFLAKILQSLLSEENCCFPMSYETIQAPNWYLDKDSERLFQMTLMDPQHSRNIMEYVILPLLIENRPAIKDYIRQDAELAPHAETLCSAVDHLEEIYAGTTDLTLGYRLIENQWD